MQIEARAPQPTPRKKDEKCFFAFSIFFQNSKNSKEEEGRV